MVHFFEAFPELSIEDSLYNYFSGTMVEKVSASRTKMLAFIYCQSDQLLHRRTIHTMEHALYSQVFRKMGVQPKLEMYYPFAASYDVDELVEKCEEILKEELKEHDTIEHMKFCSHPFEVDGNSIVLTCDDDFLCHEKSKEIKEFLSKRLKRSFGQEVDISFRYEKKERKINKEPEVYTVVRKKEEKENEEAVEEARKIQKKKTYVAKKKKTRDPGVFFGSNVEGAVMPISDIVDEIGEVVIAGMIRSVEEREFSNGEKLIINFAITDFTDTIRCLMFVKKTKAEELSLSEFIKGGNYVKVKGHAAFDDYSKELVIKNIDGAKEIDDFRVGRKDEAPVKRVELHAHTQMSDMDAVVDCQKLVTRAQEWGHPAIAITDPWCCSVFLRCRPCH